MRMGDLIQRDYLVRLCILWFHIDTHAMILLENSKDPDRDIKALKLANANHLTTSFGTFIKDKSDFK